MCCHCAEPQPLLPLPQPPGASRVQLQLDLHQGLQLGAFSELLQLDEGDVQDAWVLLEVRAGELGAQA